MPDIPSFQTSEAKPNADLESSARSQPKAALYSLKHLRWTYIYVLLIPLVNWSFAHVPTIALPHGGMWAPMAIITGLILVFRDFAQREVGHYIFIPLIIGLAVSYLMAPPAIALASTAAFAISELVDWAIYSLTKRPLSSRIMLSSLVSAPLDTVVFWYGASFVVAGTFNAFTLLTSIASKLFGAYIVYLILKRRERLQSIGSNSE